MYHMTICLLDKKKIMGTKKVYCVLCDGIFYYFDKSTSKKQIGAFYTKGELSVC